MVVMGYLLLVIVSLLILKKENFEKRIEQFIDPKIDEDILKQTYGLTENKSWRINEQRIKLQKEIGKIISYKSFIDLSI